MRRAGKSKSSLAIQRLVLPHFTAPGKMIIASFDLGGTVGFACGGSDFPPWCGSHELPLTGDDVGAYLAAFDDWLYEMLAYKYIDLIAFEAPIIRPGKTSLITARKLIGLSGHLEFIAHRRGIQCREMLIQNIKKHLSGHGNATKTEMIYAAARLGMPGLDEHAADAFGGWLLALKSHAPEEWRQFIDRHKMDELTG